MKEINLYYICVNLLENLCLMLCSLVLRFCFL